MALDEQGLLPRLLASVSGCFDEIVLTDTGSTDGTVDCFLQWCETERELYPGFLFDVAHYKWDDDFGHARQFALSQLTSDWAVYADCDEVVAGASSLRTIATSAKPEVDGVSFFREYHPGYIDFVPRLTRRGKAEWRGVRHEALNFDGPRARASGVEWTHSRPDTGGRDERGGGQDAGSGGYLERDKAALLREVLKDESDARSTFYLAQTCRDLGQPEEAAHWYEQRVALAGWDEECFYAAFEAAKIRADQPQGDYWALAKAWEMRPSRAEPLYELCWRLRTRGMPELAYTFAKRAEAIPLSQDALFVHSFVYEWGSLFELSIAAALTGRVAEAVQCNRRLLHGGLPDDVRAQAERNLGLISNG